MILHPLSKQCYFIQRFDKSTYELLLFTRNFTSNGATFPYLFSPFVSLFGDLWPRDVFLLSFFVECVQYVDLLPSAVAAKSTPAFCCCPRGLRLLRRSGPFNNPLSHFCVSEEGREREREDCGVPRQRRAGEERSGGTWE